MQAEIRKASDSRKICRSSLLFGDRAAVERGVLAASMLPGTIYAPGAIGRFLARARLPGSAYVDRGSVSGLPILGGANVTRNRSPVSGLPLRASADGSFG